MPGPKAFEIANDQATLIITPLDSTGSLVGENIIHELEALIKRLDESEDLKHVVFDFEQIEFFGSSMLGAMQALWKHVSPGGGKMALCNVSDVEREVLQISRFDTIWPIVDSREEALAAVIKT